MLITEWPQSLYTRTGSLYCCRKSHRGWKGKSPSGDRMKSDRRLSSASFYRVMAGSAGGRVAG